MPDAYEQLLDRAKRIKYLRDANYLLNWDQQVTMPPGGAPARAKQQAAVSATMHDLLVDDEVGEWLDAAAPDGEGEQAVVRELRRRHERESAVPADLVERHAEAASEAQGVWQDAKSESDWSAFAPTLSELVDLRTERARHVDPDAPTYRVLYDDQMPTLPLETVERVFDQLRERVPELAARVEASDADLPRPFEGETFPESDQEALNEAALDFIGYPRDRGRLDTSPHPFTSGTQFDARVTTRYKESDPMDALTATIHEFGHASYQLGLPKDEYGSPLGSARWEVHESQSRFWENHVGRTRAFWEEFAPTFNDHLGTDHDAETLYRASNRVYPENVIRVEADELTYHMHIILRHDIERELLDGDLTVEAVPDRWNELMAEYLGVVPEDDAGGPLQDIHWTMRFGGFPSYTIGSVLAAQLTAAMEDDLDVEAHIREREFGPLWDWMTEHVHRHGQRYTADELVEVATGEPLTADYFLEYVEAKFADLYDL